MNYSELKYRAKQQLGGSALSQSWLIAVVVSFLVTACLSGIEPATKKAAPMVMLIISGPIYYASAGMFLQQARDGQPMHLADIFSGFSDDFVGTFLIHLLRTIYVALWSLLFVIPGIIKAYSYSMAFLIKADHPEMTASECLAASSRLMEGHKMDLFLLDLSFIGWYIVGSLCAGVGVFWVSAYVAATHAQYYEELLARTFG